MGFTGDYAPINGAKDAKILPTEDYAAIVAAPPPFVGAIVINKTGPVIRIATGTSVAGDWKTVTFS